MSKVDYIEASEVNALGAVCWRYSVEAEVLDGDADE
jgi:hypothetical protein